MHAFWRAFLRTVLIYGKAKFFVNLNLFQVLIKLFINMDEIPK